VLGRLNPVWLSTQFRGDAGPISSFDGHGVFARGDAVQRHFELG
jgi:hypothetical protein